MAAHARLDAPKLRGALAPQRRAHSSVLARRTPVFRQLVTDTARVSADLVHSRIWAVSLETC